MFGASKTKQVSSAANYIEDVFSTYLYTGTGASLTITNGIDLSTKGGLVWCKARASAYDNSLYDTARGINKELYSNTTGAQYPGTGTLTSFNTDGFTLGSNSSANSGTSVSWTFRKQPKFFDVVTYTGNGTAGRTVAHSLGSVPGCIIVKRTDSSGFDWAVYHRSLSASGLPARFCSIFLNQTSAAGQYSTFWNETDPTSTDFTVGTSSSVNTNGATYVAYIFAHNAGGFGLTGTDNVISCGSYTETSGTVSVNLGYEPQWLLVKPTSTTGSWYLVDNMRGFSQTADAVLFPNLSNAESAYTPYWKPTSTGFTVDPLFGAGTSFIYIAIRRGPMKVPTDATKVFKPLAVNNSSGTVNTTGFPIDMQMQSYRLGLSGNAQVIDRLRGISSTSSSGGVRFSGTSNTNAESSPAIGTNFDNTGFATGGSWAGSDMSYWNFQRAPSFFDEVCYTGLGATPQNLTHNLGATPELIIVKARSDTRSWGVYHKDVGAGYYMLLDSTATPTANVNAWNNTAPTSSVFSVGNSNLTNNNISGGQNVAYLFATCAGVSKVGSYTGNGTTQTINCGFAGGARFVLIKRTDSTGDWYVYDTARGMTTLTDPYLLLNSTAAETATLGSVTTVTTGFAVNASILAAINTNAATYIFLAIA